MTTAKQNKANQNNALLSTGPVTDSGKAIVSLNAMRHGIFTKDLIVTCSFGKEDQEEYEELLSNLISSLSPQNQIESLLVEKIAIDFWRLRRVIRFEAGSIGKYLETIFQEFYSYGKQNNLEIEKEIEGKQQYIDWIDRYVECLKKEEVNFNNPTWAGEDVESNIVDDFSLIIKTIDTLSRDEKDRLLYDNCSYEELKKVVSKNGYSSKKEISTKLTEIYGEQRQSLENEIRKLEKNKVANIEADKLNGMLGMVPQEENTDKILKYERSLQKSIFQNLFLLKKLQGCC